MNDSLISSLLLFKKSFHSIINMQCLKYNLTSAELFLLGVLEKEGDLHQIEIAKKISCDKSHVHRTSLRLEEKGLIEITLNDNEKSQRLHLTKAGEKITKAVDNIISSIKDTIYSGVSEKDLLLVAKTVKKFTQNILTYKEKEKKNV